MISAGGFRKGSRFLYKDDPYEVVDFQHSLRGRGRGKIWTKMKNIRTGKTLEESFSSDTQFDEPDLENKDMQFLYEEPETYYFMDTVTYEQFSFPKDSIGDAKYFVKEGETYQILLWRGQPLSVNLSASFVLKIVETEPALKGDTVSNTTKRAVTETGLEIKVPLFIGEGELVKIDTRSLQYISRA